MALHIYAQMFPWVAVVFTLAAFYFKDKNFVPSFLAAIFWYVSSMTAVHITFIECCGQDPSYTADGTSDVVYLFGLLALLMLVYTFLIILKIGVKAAQGGKGDGI